MGYADLEAGAQAQEPAGRPGPRGGRDGGQLRSAEQRAPRKEVRLRAPASDCPLQHDPNEMHREPQTQATASFYMFVQPLFNSKKQNFNNTFSLTQFFTILPFELAIHI